MAKKSTAALLVMAMAIALGWLRAPTADAAGVTTHAWMAQRAIPLVSDPALRALLLAHRSQVLGGAHFPDSGFNFGYGEEAHWSRFSYAYADQIRADARCGDLTDPGGRCADRIAHLFGAVAHGLGDEVWDWLFEPNAPDHGEAGYVPPAMDTVLQTLGLHFSNGGHEFQMDMIAIGDYGRPLRPALPAWPDRGRLANVFDAIRLRPEVRRGDLDAGQRLIDVGRSALDSPFARGFHPDFVRNLPWTSAHIVSAPGGVDFASRAIAAVWDNLWARLLGSRPPTTVAITYPAPGATDVPFRGWDRSEFNPGSNPDGGGGARTRITAVLDASLPYLRFSDDPGSLPAELPAGAMTLTEVATGDPVPLRAGYPRIVPYDVRPGEHTIDLQPDGDLAPCTEYRVDVTEALLDGDGAPVVPYSWTFRTKCPGETIVRGDARIRLGTTGAWVGTDVYRGAGVTQGRSAHVPRGTPATFALQVANRGSAPDRFTVAGQGSITGYDVRYLDATGADVTAAVVAGTYDTGVLSPRASADLRVVVTPRGAAPADGLARRVVVSSTTDPSATDAVRVTVTPCTPGACPESGERPPPAESATAVEEEARALVALSYTCVLD